MTTLGDLDAWLSARSLRLTVISTPANSVLATLQSKRSDSTRLPQAMATGATFSEAVLHVVRRWEQEHIQLFDQPTPGNDR